MFETNKYMGEGEKTKGGKFPLPHLNWKKDGTSRHYI